MDTETLLTVKEAAQLLGVSESAIRNATLEGRLLCVTKFGRKLVSREALSEYKERTQPGGIKLRGRPRRLINSSAPLPSSGLPSSKGKEGS